MKPTLVAVYQKRYESLILFVKILAIAFMGHFSREIDLKASTDIEPSFYLYLIFIQISVYQAVVITYCNDDIQL